MLVVAVNVYCFRMQILGIRMSVVNVYHIN